MLWLKPETPYYLAQRNSNNYLTNNENIIYDLLNTEENCMLIHLKVLMEVLVHI